MPGMTQIQRREWQRRGYFLAAVVAHLLIALFTYFVARLFGCPPDLSALLALVHIAWIIFVRRNL